MKNKEKLFTNYICLSHSSFAQGEQKRPESFWSTIKSIWRVLRTRYGNVRLDFGQPFSLQVGLLVEDIFFRLLVLFSCFRDGNFPFLRQRSD